MRRMIGVVAGAVFGVMLVANCSAPGSMMNELADMAGVADMVGVGDAKAQGTGGTVMEAQCNHARVRTQTGSTVTTYFAEFDVAGLNPSAAFNVSAIACDFQTSGGWEPYGSECNGGTGCSVSGYTPPATTCAPVSPRFANGKVIVMCGQMVGTFGSVAQTVHLRID